MTQVLVADLLTGRRILNVPFNTLSWTKPRNAAETMSCTIPLASRALRKLDLQNATTPAKTMLAVIENDVVMAAGPIWSRRWDDDSKVLTVGAAGMWSYFDHRLVIPVLADTDNVIDPVTGASAAIGNTDYVNYTYGLMAKRLVQQAQAWTGGSVPVVFQADEGGGSYERHYLGVVIGPNGIVDTIDVQAGWDPAKGPFTPNPLYLAYELAFAAGLPVASYTFSNAQFATLQAGIARWPKAAGAGPVSFPTDYATSAAVAAVGAKVDALPAAIVKAEGSALLNG